MFVPNLGDEVNIEFLSPSRAIVRTREGELRLGYPSNFAIVGGYGDGSSRVEVYGHGNRRSSLSVIIGGESLAVPLTKSTFQPKVILDSISAPNPDTVMQEISASCNS